ncbi:MAG: HAD-IC family P-type ATPase, partial [Thiotrichaceae bacterium]|nr:HAD-IC family P-type ATPase [Thiotrichaceae bacterium]
EKLSKAENIFLDKTGTITYGTFQVSEWEDITSVDHLKPLINSLEKRSRHPVAKALVQYIEENFYSELKIFSEKKIEIENFSETLGSGVSATINQQYIEVVALKHCDRTAQQAIQKKLNQIGIYINQQLVAKISLSDKVRRDAPDAIKSLKKLGIIPGIISGDIPEVVETVRCELNITSDLAWAKISPEKKNEIVSRYDNAIMVGDGANDALALSQSFVGIAVAGSVEVSLRAADVYLTSPGVTPIVNLIEISKESMKVIYRNLTFSLIYNVLGTVLAIMGLVTPLLAAVLMPISSITVIASTLIGTNRLRKS